MNRSALSNRGTKTSYTIILDSGEFHATIDEGEYLEAGMKIAAVLKQGSPIIILDKGNNKYLNLVRPYYVLFLLGIIAFNLYMYFPNRVPAGNFKTTLIVINTFLVLAFMLSLATYRVTSAAKKFLLSQVTK